MVWMHRFRPVLRRCGHFYDECDPGYVILNILVFSLQCLGSIMSYIDVASLSTAPLAFCPLDPFVFLVLGYLNSRLTHT